MHVCLNKFGNATVNVTDLLLVQIEDTSAAVQLVLFRILNCCLNLGLAGMHMTVCTC